MSDDIAYESRADWQGSDGKKPPIMGKRQPIRSYMDDVANWVLCKDVPDEKCGALVLTRGLSKCPRLMDLGKKLPREKLVDRNGLRYLFELLEKEVGTSDVSMKVRRLAELVRERRREGMPVEAFLEAFDAKMREINQDDLIKISDEMAGALLVIGLELSQHELSNLMTVIDAKKGFEAFRHQKVVDAVRRVVVSPQGWGVGKPGASNWAFYEDQERGAGWNHNGTWDNHGRSGDTEWSHWVEEPWGDDGAALEDGWNEEYETYLGYSQCRKCKEWGHWGGECPRYPYTEGKGVGKGKEKGKGADKGKGKWKEGKGGGKQKGKSAGLNKKGSLGQATHMVEEDKAEVAEFASAFLVSVVETCGGGHPPPSGDTVDGTDGRVMQGRGHGSGKEGSLPRENHVGGQIDRAGGSLDGVSGGTGSPSPGGAGEDKVREPEVNQKVGSGLAACGTEFPPPVLGGHSNDEIGQVKGRCVREGVIQNLSVEEEGIADSWSSISMSSEARNEMLEQQANEHEEDAPCGNGSPSPGGDARKSGAIGRRKLGESGGMRIMIGSLVASGSARVRKARDIMAVMEKAEPSLKDARYRDAFRNHTRGGESIRVEKYEHMKSELYKATKELDNALALHGRPGCVSYRTQGDREKYGNAMAMKRQRDRDRRRKFEEEKGAELDEKEAEVQKRQQLAEKTWEKYQDSDPEKEDTPDEYFEGPPKVAQVRRGRGNRKAQKQRKRTRMAESGRGKQERGLFAAVCTSPVQKAYGVGCLGGKLGSWSCVLDTGATKALVGKSTYERYKQHVMGQDDSVAFREEEGVTKFAVANGSTVKSLFEATVPLRLANEKGEVIPAASKWSVVPDGDRSVPFLLSKEQMANLEMKLDVAGESASVTIGGNQHYIPIGARGGHLHMPMFAQQKEKVVHLQQGSGRLSNMKRRAKWAEKGVGGNGELVFLTEEQVYDLEVWDFPSAYVAGEGPLQPMDVEITRKNVEKIHRQLWHANEEQMKKWVLPGVEGKDSVNKARKIIREVVSQCAICEKHRKVPERPKVGGLIAHRPNDIVTMDVVELTAPGGPEKVWVIHVMDVATKFTKVYPKGERVRGRAVVSALMDWSQVFGAYPAKIVTDQGPEFINKLVVDFTISKGVVHMVTPAYTPASNGLIERHNGILKDIFYKLFDTMKDAWWRGEVGMEDMVNEAASAKNSVVTRMGFTAHFLAFGYHPIAHNAIDTDFSREEGAITDFVRGRDLLRMKAHEMVMKMRTNARLREMINGRLQGTRGPLEEDAKVEYHPLEQPKGVFSGRKWIGPCSVIRQESPKLVWLRFPDGTARLVHRHRVRPGLESEKIVAELRDLCVKKNLWPCDGHLQDPYGRNRGGEKEVGELGIGVDLIEDNVERNEEQQLKEIHQQEDLGANELEKGKCGGGKVDHSEGSSTDVTRKAPTNENVGEPWLEEGTAGQRKAMARSENQEGQGRPASETKAQMKARKCEEIKRAIAEKRAKRLDGYEKEEQERKRMRLVGHTWVLQEECGVEGSLQEKLGYLAGRAAAGGDDSEFDAAKRKEWEEWERHGVFEWVVDAGQKSQRSRWVLTKKENEDGEVRLKARLCAQGTAKQDEQLEELITESPTASRASLRIGLCETVRRGWGVHSFDVRCAFLQGGFLEDEQDGGLYGVEQREVFLKAPKEFAKKGMVMKLKKIVYGYADAPRRWFVESDTQLRNLGFTPTDLDPATYTLREDGELEAIVCMHVDDGFVMCSEKGMRKVALYMDRFKVGSFKSEEFVYTGVKTARGTSGRVSMDQKEYVHKLEEIKLERGRCSNKKDALGPDEVRSMRKLLGAMTWLGAQTRPDIAAEVSMLQSTLPGATVAEVVRANKMVRRVKGTDNVRLTYSPLRGETVILVFTDAALQNVPSGSEDTDKVYSQGGYVAVEAETVNGEIPVRAKFNVISWGSNKLRRVCRSSFGAETLAACVAADVAYMLKTMLTEIRGVAVKAYLVTDSLNLRDHVRCFANNCAEKRLKVDLMVLKEFFKTGELEGLLWVDGSVNLADSLTKNSSTLGKALETGRLSLETLT